MKKITKKYKNNFVRFFQNTGFDIKNIIFIKNLKI
jgi:hypothetical protein